MDILASLEDDGLESFHQETQGSEHSGRSTAYYNHWTR